METLKHKLVNKIRVIYSDHSEDFYCNAELSIDGYQIKIVDKHFPTIDEAVEDIKNRVSEACLKFEPTT